MRVHRDDVHGLHNPPPLLLCVDLQKEHLTPGRRHIMVDVDDVLAKCSAILGQWRSELWPVAHLKRVAQSAWFNAASSLTDWLDELRPLPGEMVFEHPLPSAYSSKRFSTYRFDIGRSSRIYMIGFSLEESILATVVEGFHRGHTVRVVADAVACSKPEACEQSVYRHVLLGLTANYAAVESMGNVAEPLGHAPR
jgi:nicotinamidase-related amidase